MPPEWIAGQGMIYSYPKTCQRASACGPASGSRSFAHSCRSSAESATRPVRIAPATTAVRAGGADSISSLWALAGCDTRERYEDASVEARSREVIGARHEVVGPVQAHGFRQHSRAPVEHVLLIPQPGIDGPEIGFRVPVRQGSTVTVRKVLQSDRMLEHDINLEVDLEGTPLPASAPCTIRLVWQNKGRGYVELNPKIYRKLPRS